MQGSNTYREYIEYLLITLNITEYNRSDAITTFRAKSMMLDPNTRPFFKIRTPASAMAMN